MNKSKLGLSCAVATCASLLPLADVGAAPTGGALAPSSVLEIEIAGGFGVPVDASMVALNVTTSRSDDAGFLNVYPCTDAEPGTSSLNWNAGQDLPNFVLAKLSPRGSVCVSGSVAADVIVDLAGYVPAGSSLVALDEPARVVDTRGDLGIVEIPARTTVPFEVTAHPAVPESAGAVFANVTALGQALGGYLQMFPCDAGIPDTSNVNYPPWTIVANFGSSRIAADGTICFWSFEEIELIVDVAGYMPGDTPGYTSLDAPVRAFDSRNDVGGPPGKVPASTATTVDVDGTGVPEDAIGILANVTATNWAGPGYALMYPCDQPLPGSSNLNFSTQGAVANSVMMPLSAEGTVCLYSSVETDLIVDITGYLTDRSQFAPLAPQRIEDSRTDWQQQCDFVPLIDYTFPDPPLVLYQTDGNVADDPRIPLPTVVGWHKPEVSADCATVYLVEQPVQNERYGDTARLAAVDVATGDVTVNWVDGTLLEHGIDGIEGDRVVSWQYFGGTTTVVDAFTEEVVWSQETDVGISSPTYGMVARDGEHVVLAGFGDVWEILIVQRGRSQPVGKILLEGHDDRDDLVGIDIAPDGRYVIVNGTEEGINEDGEAAEFETYRVMTPSGFGEAVGFIETFPGYTGRLLVAHFVGNGELLTCAYFATYRETVFTRFELVEQLPPSSTAIHPVITGCLSAAYR